MSAPLSDETAVPPPESGGAAPSKPSRWEWVPVGLWLLFAGWWWLRPAEATGWLVPCLAVGLAPGSLWRLLGRSSWTVHRVCFALALLTYVGLKTRWDAALFRTIAARWPWVLLGLALALNLPWLGAWRWRILLRRAGLRITYPEAARLCFTGWFFSLFIPGALGGDALRIYYVGRARNNLTGALAAGFLDRAIGLPPLLLLTLLAARLDWAFVASKPLLVAFVWPCLFFAGLSLGGLLVLCLGGRKLAKPVEWLAARKPHAVWDKLIDLARRYDGAWGTCGAALAISLLSHLMSVMGCVCFAVATGMQDIPLVRHFLIVPLGMVANTIPGAPGGLGQGETAFSDLYEVAAPGLGNDAAGVLVMLCLRLGMVIWGVAGGIIYTTGRYRVASDGDAAEAA